MIRSLRPAGLAALLAAAALGSCGGDEQAAPFATAGHQAAGGGSAGGGGQGGGQGGATMAVYLVPNVDDDDENGVADWLDPPFEADDDLATLVVSDVLAAPASSAGVVLELSGETDAIRIWLEGTAVLGATGGGERPAAGGRPGSRPPGRRRHSPGTTCTRWRPPGSSRALVGAPDRTACRRGRRYTGRGLAAP